VVQDPERQETIVFLPEALGDSLILVPTLRALRAEGPIMVVARQNVLALFRALSLGDEWLRLDTEVAEGGKLPWARLRRARVHVWLIPGLIDRVSAGGGPAGGGRAEVVNALATLALAASGAVFHAVHARRPKGTAATTVWEFTLRQVAPSIDPAWTTPLTVPASLAREGAALLRAAGWDGVAPLAMFHAGASDFHRVYPPETVAAVIAAAQAHGYTVVLHEGPMDAGPARELRARTRGVLTLRHPPLPLLAGALTHCAHYLGNDTGISHLAAALGVRSLIWFAGEEMLWWRPWSTNVNCYVPGDNAFSGLYLLPSLDNHASIQIHHALMRVLAGETTLADETWVPPSPLDAWRRGATDLTACLPGILGSVVRATTPRWGPPPFPSPDRRCP
jgi:heptosyltransferase-3